MEIEDVEKVKRTRGVASTIKARDIVPAYSEAVKRFLKDNANLGNEWQRQVASYLFDAFKGVDEEGNILGSSSYTGVALATFLPEFPLIRGKQLLGIWENAGKKNPFGNVYIDFGVQANGKPKVNPAQAKILLESLGKYNLKEPVVPDFYQLRLVPDQNTGLAFEISQNVNSEDLTPVSAYPFEGRVGKDGLFRAGLDSDGWYAGDDSLAGSCDDGRGVRYDAEGVASQNHRRDLASDLTEKFVGRF